MRTNTRERNNERTHEGAIVYPHLTLEQQLRRSVMSCLLWENEFYEDGEEIAGRIKELVRKSSIQTVAEMAVEARSRYNLRHVPLYLLACLVHTHNGDGRISQAICDTIQRADELGEFLAIYAKVNGWKPGDIRKLSKQAQKGLAMAFNKFNEYAFAKYDRDGAVKLRDAMFLAHPKPIDVEAFAALRRAKPNRYTRKERKEAKRGEYELSSREMLFQRIAERSLETPDTWEVNLSTGADKKESWERLLNEGKLGYLALLRNLRNMEQAGVSEKLVRKALLAREGGADRVLPFRYIAAARACPQMEPTLDTALQACISDLPVLPGKTLVLVDVSGSMDDKLSGKSDLTRADAACALASIINGDVRMFSFSNHVVEVPPRRGMAGVDALLHSQPHSGTELFNAVSEVNTIPHDRMIVITDEQAFGYAESRYDAHNLPKPAKHGYMINVASNKNGVGYGKWHHIDGFSENVIRWIMECENF